jgi:Tfp pilus assembly protein PilN
MWSKPVQSISMAITLTPTRLEGAVYTVATQQVVATYGYDLPLEVFAAGHIKDEAFITQHLTNLYKHLGAAKNQKVYLAISADLCRIMEMPVLERRQMLMAVSSEAERFRAFDATDALVDFKEMDIMAEGRKQRVLAAGMRKDTAETLAKLCAMAKVPVASMSVFTVEVLRGFAGSGVLNALVQQGGQAVCWGMLLYEGETVRLVVCEGTQIDTLREIQINLSQAEQESLFLIEDLVDEIQRTTRHANPRLWFVDGMSDNVVALLNKRLATPLKPLTLPAQLWANCDPVHMGTLGTALTPYVSFPFNPNIYRSIKGVKGFGNGLTATAASNDAGMPGEKAGLFSHVTTKVAAVLGGLMLAGAGVFGLLNLMTGQQLAQLEQEKTTLASQLAQTQQQAETLRQRTSIHTQLLESAQRIQAHNATYQKLAKDLRQNMPSSVWIHRIKAGEGLEIEGKALEHQAVIHLARHFDEVGYLQDVDFASLKEGMVGKKPVYEFTLNAQVVTPTPPMAALAQQTPSPDPTTPLPKG